MTGRKLPLSIQRNYWIIFELTLTLVCLRQVVDSTNVNKTDTEMNLEECYNATLDPLYFKHPDKFLKAPEIIRRHGFPVEVHRVTSEDGYILELHRIPFSKRFPKDSGPKPPVFIQHGIMASSVNWILPPVEKALAYMMADIGYDVWLGNVRGSSYSLAHLDPARHWKNSEYWNFSWHEMGYYDIPAIIDHILEQTNRTKLTYIGHSMGSTMFFVCMSLRPEYNEKIDLAFALAPVAFVGNATSFFKLFAPFSYNFQRFYETVGSGQLIPELLREIINPFFASSCNFSPIINCNICSNLYFLLFNSDGMQMNYTMLPVITQHFPDRVSSRTVTHYGQNLIANTFQQFDERIAFPEFLRPSFMKKEKPPPKYDLSKVTAPLVLFYSDRDNLANPRDVDMLIRHLPNVKAAVRVCYPLFNHNDFLFGVDVRELVYDKLISILQGNWDIDLECRKTYVKPRPGLTIVHEGDKVLTDS